MKPDQESEKLWKDLLNVVFEIVVRDPDGWERIDAVMEGLKKPMGELH